MAETTGGAYPWLDTFLDRAERGVATKAELDAVRATGLGDESVSSLSTSEKKRLDDALEPVYRRLGIAPVTPAASGSGTTAASSGSTVRTPPALVDFGRAIGRDLPNSLKRTRAIAQRIREVSATPPAKRGG